MASTIATILGGTVATYLLIRLWQWILKKIPAEWTVRLVISIILAFVTATVLGGLGMADGGSPVFGVAAQTYIIPSVIAGLIEAVRLYRKSAQAAAIDQENT
jgi:hypothetical protein